MAIKVANFELCKTQFTRHCLVVLIMMLGHLSAPHGFITPGAELNMPMAVHLVGYEAAGCN